KLCKEMIKQRFEWAERSHLDATIISFPGGFAKVIVSDLGIIGQIGLLLILSWSFFAVRRENHAIRAIVDMDEASRNLNRWFPKRFKLIPKNSAFSAEH